MDPAADASPAAEPASLIVTDPGGHRTRVPIAPLPFLIGRQPQSNLILRDSRVSRTHARIVFELVVELLAAGWSHAQILASYPHLTEEDIRSCLAYAGELLREEKVYPLNTA